MPKYCRNWVKCATNCLCKKITGGILPLNFKIVILKVLLVLELRNHLGGSYGQDKDDIGNKTSECTT